MKLTESEVALLFMFDAILAVIAFFFLNQIILNLAILIYAIIIGCEFKEAE